MLTPHANVQLMSEGPFISARDMFKIMPRIMSGLFYDNDLNWITGILCRMEVNADIGVELNLFDDIAGSLFPFGANPNISGKISVNYDDFLVGTLFGGLYLETDSNNAGLKLTAEYGGRNPSDDKVVMTGESMDFNQLMMLSADMCLDDYDDPYVKIGFVKKSSVPKSYDDWRKIAEGACSHGRAVVIIHDHDAECAVYDGRGIGGSLDEAFDVIRERNLIPFFVQSVDELKNCKGDDDYESVCAIYCVEEWNVMRRTMSLLTPGGYWEDSTTQVLDCERKLDVKSSED